MSALTVLAQIERLAKPGITIKYTDLNNVKDNGTISDPNNEIQKMIKSQKIGDIVLAVYKNTSYKGTVVVDKQNKIFLADNGKIHDIKTTIIGSQILQIKDSLNNKTTTIEYAKDLAAPVTVVSLQDQLLQALKKKKMTDKEVTDFIVSFNKTKK